MRIFKFVALAFLLGSGYYTTSQAALVDISLTPADCVVGSCWTTDQNSNMSIAEVEALTGFSNLTSQYKMNVGDANDSGPFAGSYTTTFANSATDPADATISLDNGATPINCGGCLLVVKDGNQSPAQYVFDLSLIGMIENIFLTGFWPDNGAISHVEILTGVSPVPVPAAVWLFGTALIGFVGLSRKTKV
jgi:hypothetical protein